MDKKDLSERDICTKFIHEALRRAGWDLHEKVFEEYPLTKGPVIVRGKHVARGQRKRADYVLFHKPNQPLAIIEAKDNKHSVRAGMQQALEYAELLDVPVVFSSNGDGFLAHDLTGTRDPIEEELTRAGVDLAMPEIDEKAFKKAVARAQQRVRGRTSEMGAVRLVPVMTEALAKQMRAQSAAMGAASPTTTWTTS